MEVTQRANSKFSVSRSHFVFVVFDFIYIIFCALIPYLCFPTNSQVFPLVLLTPLDFSNSLDFLFIFSAHFSPECMSSLLLLVGTMHFNIHCSFHPQSLFVMLVFLGGLVVFLLLWFILFTGI